MMVALCAIVARATDFTEDIIITVNGVSSQQKGVITINDRGDSYDLLLNNFMLQSEDGPMGVGNVEIKNVKPLYSGNTVILLANETVTLTPGNDPSVTFWMATMLPPVPVQLQAAINGDHLRSYIFINLESMNQIVEVSIGSGYQPVNPGFEAWHTTTGSYEEPNGWHSFESASGSLASMAGHHISRSADAHSGEASARLFSTSIFGIIANGTMTTGRMNAGAMTASDPKNNAYMDMSMEDKDGNGDPFYMPLISRPDSLAFWVKFKQGKANEQHPYATVSAAITDGTYYQDPVDKDYTNVVAKASYPQITASDSWQRIVAPFTYTANAIDPKAVLITISTNADAGQGSNGDELLADDIAFIYNAKLASLRIKGQEVPAFNPATLEYQMKSEAAITADDIEATANGQGTYVAKYIETEGNKYVCHILAFSADMSQNNHYVVNVESSALSVRSHDIDSQQSAIYYTLDGLKASKLSSGRIYVRKSADGSTRKILR